MNAQYSIIELPFIMLSLIAVFLSMTLIIRWRKQEIGSDFDTFWGWLTPRSGLMWVWAIATWTVIILTLFSVLVWVWHLRDLPDLPLVVGTALGVIGWLSTYAYDRHYASLVKRGQ